MKRYLLILVCFSGCFTPVVAQPDSLHHEAVESYQEESYRDALELWQELERRGYQSADLYYNIGNAAYKSKNIPLAILYYERAKLLRPGDEDIRYNLELANAWQEDKIEQVPEVFLKTWYRKVTLWFPSNQWAVISLVAAGLFLAGLFLFLTLRSNSLKRVFLTFAIAFFITGLAGFVFSRSAKKMISDHPFAIVFSPSVTARNTPDESGTHLFIIHEGLKVRIEDRVDDWLEIRLPDGKKGWIPAQTVEKI